MSHGPATEWKEDAKTSRKKSKLGIWMFLLYAVIYAVFIIINVIDPKIMGLDIGGLNLAIVYGFGLIIFALILALIYNAICGKMEQEAEKTIKLEKKLQKGGK